jgi:hypothetical protein
VENRNRRGVLIMGVITDLKKLIEKNQQSINDYALLYYIKLDNEGKVKHD